MIVKTTISIKLIRYTSPIYEKKQLVFSRKISPYDILHEKSGEKW